MNLLKRFWRWFTTPRRDETQERIRVVDKDSFNYDEAMKPKDLSSLAEVPVAHPGVVLDPNTMIKTRSPEPIPDRHQDLTDWDLLNDDQRYLFEQITPHDPSKEIKYPAPVEQSTQDWVTERLTKMGYNEAAHQRFVAFRRVAVGMSMRHLGDLKRRADDRDTSLTAHDLIALRSRGIA
jgi:hypothetical protein